MSFEYRSKFITAAEAAAKVAGGEAASGQDAALYDQFLRKAGESSETGSR